MIVGNWSKSGIGGTQTSTLVYQKQKMMMMMMMITLPQSVTSHLKLPEGIHEINFQLRSYSNYMPWSRLLYVNRSRPAKNKHHWCHSLTRKQHSSLHPHLHFGALTSCPFSGTSTSSQRKYQRKYFLKTFDNLINALSCTFGKLRIWANNKMWNTCTIFLYLEIPIPSPKLVPNFSKGPLLKFLATEKEEMPFIFMCFYFLWFNIETFIAAVYRATDPDAV